MLGYVCLHESIPSKMCGPLYLSSAQQQLNGEAHVEEDIEAQPHTRVLITLWIDPFPSKRLGNSSGDL